jgi:hypothetical protein
VGIHDATVLVDDEVAAKDAHVLTAVHRLLAPGVIGLGNLVVRVDEEREWQAVVVPELLV